MVLPSGCLAVITLVLAYSCDLQLNVNALPFFSYFRLQFLFSSFHDPKVTAYFTRRPFGVIDGDILASKEGRPWEPLQLVAPRINPALTSAFIGRINQLTTGNYYWWSDDLELQTGL
jgi:hypothetical protein